MSTHLTEEPFFASKQTFTRIDFLRQGEQWWPEMALIMLNLLLKTRQKQLRGVHVHGQRNGKRVRLRLTTQAVTGHTSHGQRKQHHGKAEVRWN